MRQSTPRYKEALQKIGLDLSTTIETNVPIAIIGKIDSLPADTP